IIAIMRSVEERITSSAPRDFPNRLGTDGRALDLDDELKKQILELEEQMSAQTEGFSAACIASQQAMEAENEMLFQAHELHLRWLDLRAAPRRALLVGRLKYLKSLQEAFGISPQRDDNSE
ncbi:MAG TPA: hypothetical protein VGB93_02045, partial [Methylovirgula sp.]